AALIGTVVVLLTASTPAGAQSGRITGQIVDGTSGAPMANVQVTIEELELVQITSSAGRYLFVNVRPGTYTVIAEFLGYATVRREGVQVTVDATSTVDFQLLTQAIALEDLYVEAERVPLVTLDRT